MVTMQNREFNIPSTTTNRRDDYKYQLNCAQCDGPLVILWVVRPEFYLPDGTLYNYKYRANCPYCGCHSEEKQLDGEVKVLPVCSEGQTTDGQKFDKLVTTIDDVQNDNGVCNITVGKFKTGKA